MSRFLDNHLKTTVWRGCFRVSGYHDPIAAKLQGRPIFRNLLPAFATIATPLRSKPLPYCAHGDNEAIEWKIDLRGSCHYCGNYSDMMIYCQ
ncbi:hypothetical protein NA78x_005878 [Anatilimnocola sp. NA78]|uniref:hypothetical protein n=1 Tax=Anatilimnocola sp. NA78 TaxID=3415683 RepID=UPI003CE4DE79